MTEMVALAQYLVIISCVTIFCLASSVVTEHESGDNRPPTKEPIVEHF